MLNGNSIKKKLNNASPNTEIKTIIDSAWLLDLPYLYLCSDPSLLQSDVVNEENCIINKIFLKALQFWNASLPNECYQMKKLNDCFLPSKFLPYSSRLPVFIIQSLYDETQIQEQFKKYEALIVETDPSNTVLETKNQVELLRSTFKTVSQNLLQSILSSLNRATDDYFLTACTTHMISMRSDWTQIQINNFFLEKAIFCWANNKNSSDCMNEKIEICHWPDCNGKCLFIPHPEQNNVAVTTLEYFSYFGLVNYESLSSALNKSTSFLKKFSNYNQTMNILFNLL
jgi:hypothetical protein